MGQENTKWLGLAVAAAMVAWLATGREPKHDDGTDAFVAHLAEALEAAPSEVPEAGAPIAGEPDSGGGGIAAVLRRALGCTSPVMETADMSLLASADALGWVPANGLHTLPEPAEPRSPRE